jgi:CheY-like chemotaxis protein
MTDGLKILIAEDCATDAELINYALRKAGLRFEATWVETREKYVEAIREFEPDIIISDFEMPEFKGSSALAISMTECPDVPFILVSGAVRESLASEMLRAGAVAYIPKQDLSLLAPTVKEALRLNREGLYPRAIEGSTWQ